MSVADRGVLAAGLRHLALVHKLECVVHRFCYGERGVRADEAHHIESVRGDHSNLAAIPLCGSCHDELHDSRRRAFYVAHKIDDVKLLAWTIMLVEEFLRKPVL